MRITISTIGSRGDVQPYVALGKGLKAAGHTVTIATDKIFEDFISSHGLDFAYIAADPMKALEVDISKLGNNPFKVFRWISENASRGGEAFIRSYLEANRGTDLMMFSSIAAMLGVHVGGALNVPMIATTLQPVVPTRYYPYSAAPILPEWLPFWEAINKATYTYSNLMFFRMFYKMVNQGREEILGLPPLAWKHFTELDLSQYPMLHGFSRHVIPKPRDYDQNQIFTGYWFLDQEEDWQPDDQLVEFLAASPKPIYVGFGSMVDQEAQELTDIVIQALAISGQRAVLLGGWTNLGDRQLPDTILKVSHVPHEWLLPQVAAAVHHGGAGTTSASLRAGTPTVVVPFFADQPFWGWRVQKLGVGPKPIPRQKLTAAKLAAAIRQAVNDPDIQEKAKTLGENIRAEDGIRKAVEEIERLYTTQRDVLMPIPLLTQGG